VVKLEGGAGDVGLERIEAVGQGGQLVRHGKGSVQVRARTDRTAGAS
jgi:hypothetical protein